MAAKVPSRAARSVARGARRPRWRRILAWVGGGLALMLVALVVAVVTAPRWAAGRIETELEQRVGKRLGAEVDIGELEASWSGARLDDVELRADGVEITVASVEVHVDRRALWSGRAEVTEITGVGGHIKGERAGIEALAARVRTLELDGDADARGWLRGRTRLTPDALELRGLSFVIDDEDRRVTGSLAASVAPEARRVELRVTTLMAELGLGPPVRAAKVQMKLEQRDGQLSFPIVVEVAGVAAQVNENIALAGVHGSLTVHDRAAQDLSVELGGGFGQTGAAEREWQAGDDLWSVAGRFARDLSAGKVAVDMQSFELGRVPEVLDRLPLVESDHATVGGHLEVDFGQGVAKLDGKLALAGLNLSHRLLAREVVRDIGVTLDIDATVDPGARRLDLNRLVVSRGGVELVATGELIHAAVRDQRRYQVDLDVPPVSCQAVLDAIPRELVPGLAGFELSGEFRAHVAIDADFADLDALKLDGDIGIGGCRVAAAPRLASVEHLNGAFVHRVTMRDGRTRRVALVPGSSSYTRLDNISRYMSEAVLTTEDGSFRRHDGFNRSQLEVALRRNLKSGKVRIGASTITMQMVKNVLLSHERTLSRKLQELFLTWWVEQALSKQRIMELYLNVIEFGPGIYGVTDASRHYFGKHPSELGSLEAAMLAAMLPSPVRRHVHYCNGALDERFEAKVRWIHDLMLERERIGVVEHDIYAALGITLDLFERGDPQLCLDEIDTLMAGTETQRALSGLLGDGDAGESWGLPGVRTEPSLTWGLRPPLPSEAPFMADEFGDELGGDGAGDGPGDAADGTRGPRLEPDRLEPGDAASERWGQPDNDDPANSDAPGRPAMDAELP